ncbi:MAG: site-2 protease family protein [candidate division Zixibacteria bacterium]|nr:site-2 protease family protein [candidate division Zixibacteria bacterium]
MDKLIYYLIITPPLLFAITVHEYSHGWMAYRKGDPTAKLAGRLTLNPISHIDIVGLLLLYFYGFGWAKPVPINPNNFKNPRKDELWVSLAGPASNMLLAFALGLLFRIIYSPYSFTSEPSSYQLIILMLVKGIQLNLVLTVFNLLPVKPLDGSHILAGLLPPQYNNQLTQIQRFAPYVLLGIIFLDYFLNIGILWSIFGPFIIFFGTIFAGPEFIRLIYI